MISLDIQIFCSLFRHFLAEYSLFGGEKLWYTTAYGCSRLSPDEPRHITGGHDVSLSRCGTHTLGRGIHPID